jgi:hypothetical protein
LGTGKTISAVARNLELWDMLHRYQGEVDLEFARMMWRFPGRQPFYPTLEEADAAYYQTKGAGRHQKICSMENAMVGIMQPDDGDEGLYYVSQGCAARLTSPLMPKGHYYRVAPTYSFYQLKLDSSPRRVAEAAKQRAQYDQYYANLELRKLNYHDAAYAPLVLQDTRPGDGGERGHLQLGQGAQGLHQVPGPRQAGVQRVGPTT